MLSSKYVVNVYYYLLFASILFGLINAVNTTLLTANHNKHGNYPNLNVRDHIRFLVFSSWWTVAVTPFFMWKIHNLGLLVHGIFVFITWSFSLVGAVLITTSLKGFWTGSAQCAVYCGQTNAAAAFAWILCLLMTVAFILASYCLFIALTHGDILLGRIPPARSTQPSTATLPVFNSPEKSPFPSPFARTIHVPSPAGVGAVRQSLVGAANTNHQSPNLVASVAMLHPHKNMNHLGSPAVSALTATPILNASPALTSTPTLAAIPMEEERRQNPYEVTPMRGKRSSWLERVFRRSGNDVRRTDQTTPPTSLPSYIKYISSDDLHS